MKYFRYIVCFFCLIQCDNIVPISTDELIEQEVFKKQEAYKKESLEDCRLNAILEAEIYVDSIIHKMHDFSVLDSVDMISKPNRPNRPEYLEIEDPGPIKPFEKE